MLTFNTNLFIPNVLKKEVVHVAFFIQDEDGYSNKGIILDYGPYEYIDDKKFVFEYKEEGGLRFGYIKYQAFMSDSGKTAMVNLKSRPVRFNYLIDTLKKIGNWRQKDYYKHLNNTHHLKCILFYDDHLIFFGKKFLYFT